VRINKELLERKVAAPAYKTEINDRRGSAAVTTRHTSIRRSWRRILPTSGGRSVGIVRFRIKGHGVRLFVLFATVLPPLLSSGQNFWLLTQRSRVRFSALPDFLSSSGSGTGSTQPL
jgi:hypothetical protein